MGKALKNRLNGNKEEFLECVRVRGDWEALELWKDRLDGYSSYSGLRKFILEETGDPKYGLNINRDTQSTFKKFISAWTEYATQIRSENERLRAENEALKRELKIREAEDIGLILPLMDEISGERKC